jgi:hypothetical protein
MIEEACQAADEQFIEAVDGFKRRTLVERAKLSIYNLLIPENGQCMFCQRTAKDMIGHLRNHFEHRPFLCPGYPSCDSCPSDR